MAASNRAATSNPARTLTDGRRGPDSRPAPSRTSGLQRRPGLVDPGVRRRRLPLRPAGRRGDRADRDRDDPRGIENRERIFIRVLAESDERVLVALMVVGADVDV